MKYKIVIIDEITKSGVNSIFILKISLNKKQFPTKLINTKYSINKKFIINLTVYIIYNLFILFTII